MALNPMAESEERTWVLRGHQQLAGRIAKKTSRLRNESNGKEIGHDYL